MQCSGHSEACTWLPKGCFANLNENPALELTVRVPKRLRFGPIGDATGQPDLDLTLVFPREK